MTDTTSTAPTPPVTGSESIGPTAHYTAYLWAANRMSHPALVTNAGRVLFHAMRPPLMVAKALGGPSLEGFLLARHRLIDDLLETAIEAGEVSQVIEIACGLSPRGWRFARRHGDALTYVEADLPGMAARKRRALEPTGSLGDHHRVVEIDALAQDGPHSLAALAQTLDPRRGVAIVTEGLLNYLGRDGLDSVWRQIAATLSGFPHGLYLSDVHLGSDNGGLAAGAFMRGLSAFVRSRVHLHFDSAGEACDALRDAGFASAVLHRPADFADRLEIDRRASRPVRVIEARTARATS
jgi:O-methyltransferase involved in polyketide biosynthesis